jgi:hypothetical protein
VGLIPPRRGKMKKVLVALVVAILLVACNSYAAQWIELPGTGGWVVDTETIEVASNGAIAWVKIPMHDRKIDYSIVQMAVGCDPRKKLVVTEGVAYDRTGEIAEYISRFDMSVVPGTHGDMASQILCEVQRLYIQEKLTQKQEQEKQTPVTEKGMWRF